MALYTQVLMSVRMTIYACLIQKTLQLKHIEAIAASAHVFPLSESLMEAEGSFIDHLGIAST